MEIFLLSGVLILAVLAVLFAPFFIKHQSAMPELRESAIYQDQLAEIDRDLDRGVLTETQANNARNEVERRLLLAMRRQGKTVAAARPQARFAMMAAIGLLPVFAGAAYLKLGAPEQPAAPFASRTAAEALPAGIAPAATAAGTHSEMRSRIAELETRLAEEPNDVEGQALLGRSYASIGEYPNALRAYAEANRLSEGRDVRLAGEYAEIMVITNGGEVPADAEEIFRLIKEDFPNDPQASYYLALGMAQRGDTDGAVAMLTDLRSQSPENAPWLETVNGLLAEISPQGASAARAPVRAPERQPERTPRGPTRDQVNAAQAMTDSDRDAMINGMVEGLAARLAENPDDLQGWQQLARAYVVLGKTESARTAYEEVLARAPNDPDAKTFLQR